MILALFAALPETAEAMRISTSTKAGGQVAEGVARFERGDYEGAARALQASLEDALVDPDLALLLGISYYRLGRDEEAEPLMETASKSDDPETADTARVFLGLIAGDKGEVDRARTLLTSAAQASTPDVAQGAATLLDAVMPRTLTLSLLARSEYDSNVPLTALSAVPASTFGQTSDAAVLGLAGAVFRPFSSLGLAVGDTISFRKHFQLTSYDLFSNTTHARWEYLGASDRVSAAYAFDVAALGGSLFFYGNALEAGYRRAIAGDVGVGLRYGLRQRHYALTDYAAYTGFVHSGALEVSFGTPEQRMELNLGLLALRELTSDPTLTATAFGVRVHAKNAVGPFFGLVSATGLERTFDARRDSQLIGEVTLGYLVTEALALVLGGSYVANLSNVADYDYRKWVTHLGVEYSLF